MSKHKNDKYKDTAVDEETEEDTSVDEETVDEVEDEKPEKPAKASRQDKSDNQRDGKSGKDKKVVKKKKEPSKAARAIKDFFSELKKVTWPKFPNVLKQTGIVLMFTVIFMIVFIGFDYLFGLLHGLLLSNLPGGESAIAGLVDGIIMLTGGLL